jgi:AraC family transcriptional regulator
VIDHGDAGHVSLSSLARTVGRHPVHVAREFRRHYGTSIGEYHRRTRLRRARELMRSRAPFSEIAFACGFSSHSHLSRAFKAEFGMTPSAFRAQR